MQHLKTLAERADMRLKLSGFTANVVRWRGRAAHLEASQGRLPDVAGESGAATEIDLTIVDEAFSSKPFSSRVSLPNQDSSRGARPSTESESAKTAEHNAPGFGSRSMGRTLRATVGAIAFAFALTGCGKSGGGRGGPPPIAVNVAQAQRTDIATYLALDGQITPLLQSTLSTPQSGTVEAVYVTEGGRVTRGELLAKIDDSTLRAQLAQAQGQVAQALATLQGQSLQNPITNQSVKSAVTSAEQTLASARNTLVSDEEAEANARLVYNQNKMLIGQGFVSQTAAEQSRSQYVAAVQATANARAQVTAAQAALDTARGNLGQSGIQVQTVAAAKGTLQAQQGQVKLLQTEIAQTNLVAPFDGVITQRLLDPGAFAGPNAPILQVSQIDPVYVNVNVPDESLGYVRKGTPVSFTTSSVPGRAFHGTVYDVNATPTAGTLSYRARLVQANPDDTLRGGMLVTVQVLKERHTNAIVVPRTAIVETEAGASVFTVVDAPAPAGVTGGGSAAGGGPPGGGSPIIKQAKAVPVELGLQTDTLAEIRSPDITAGTTVITTRPDALQDKSMVAMSAPTAQGAGQTAK
jgi:multidrug efflux pump subunit AcrA (membrane-fusion protein)